MPPPPAASPFEIDLALIESSGEIEPPTLAQQPFPITPPLAESTLLSRAGVDAILDAEHEALSEWMNRAIGLADRSEVVEHVLAVAESHRGDPHVALGHALRLRAAGATGSPVERCRASLTLALALHAVGRPEEALLEGLDALGRARRAGERDAERASLALLAKVYLARGDAATARTLSEAVGA